LFRQEFQPHRTRQQAALDVIEGESTAMGRPTFRSKWSAPAVSPPATSSS